MQALATMMQEMVAVTVTAMTRSGRPSSQGQGDAVCAPAAVCTMRGEGVGKCWCLVITTYGRERCLA